MGIDFKQGQSLLLFLTLYILWSGIFSYSFLYCIFLFYLILYNILF